MKILFVGDIVGRSGRSCLRAALPLMRERFSLDAVVVNGENTAGGIGATPKILRELLDLGVDAITLGNHTWRQKELAPGLGIFDRVVRPANYPDGVPGMGSCVVSLSNGRSLGVVNLIGRVYMDPAECPFQTAVRHIDALRTRASVVLVDFHAEATSEKVALGWYLDGRCTAVLGTHTHVQTADARILPKGTAYITDVGMTGPRDSVIGMRREPVIRRFLTGMPVEFKVEEGPVILCGVVVDADDANGRARSIERIWEQYSVSEVD